MKKEEIKLSADAEEVIRRLKNKEKLYAMIAPSFVVDFDFHTFADRLRAIGFDKVTELTFGAKEVNHFYREYLSKHPNGFYISSTCPVIVNIITERFPRLRSKLIPCVSPMVATARILKKQYPGHKRIFIGPCYAKKLDVKKHKNDLSLALTYQEIDSILKYFNKSKFKNKTYLFDRFYNDSTKIYPVSGGLAKSMHMKKIIQKHQCLVVDGFHVVERALKHLNENPENLRFVDILFCKGGCIHGPNTISKESISKRKKKLLEYMKFARKHKTGEKVGLDRYTKGVNFSNIPKSQYLTKRKL